MRYNSLTLVNKILNSLDLQAVSTIGETEDSEQVLEILDTVLTEIDLDKNWFPRRAVVRLSTASGTTTTLSAWLTNYPAIPWAMAIPENVEAVYKIYYNGKELTYLEPEEFLKRIERGSVFSTDKAPRYWTSGLNDENYIVFDSFDSTVESQLSSANSSAYVTKYPNTRAEDDDDTSTLSDKFLNLVLMRSKMYGYYELIKNIPMGDRYKTMSEELMSKLIPSSKRTKRFSVHPGNIDFSRKRRRGISIDSSEYTQIV